MRTFVLLCIAISVSIYIYISSVVPSPVNFMSGSLILNQMASTCKKTRENGHLSA